MPALLIPVKDLGNAKQRLAALFAQEERTHLAEAMLDDFCAVIRATRGAQRIILVSSYGPAIERAHAYGWEAIREQDQVSESASVDAASRWCEDHGVTSLLRLPIDLPLVQPEDVDWLLQQARPEPSMTIVASRDGTGTNALLRTPPTLFPSHFGTNSFPKHLAEARQLGAHCTVLRSPRLEMDLDDEADLRTYLAQSSPSNATRKWVESHAFGPLARTPISDDPVRLSATLD